MKKLEKTFVGNYDRVGNTRFVQVKRTKEVAMYRRENMDGSVRSYEVFLVKTRKKGDALPNGAVEKEDRECYPGTSAFGRIAYDCKTEDQAETRYDELIERAKDLLEAQEESVKTGKRVKVSRKKKVDVKLPSGKFTMKMLMSEYQLPQPTLYLIVKKWIAEAKVGVVDSVRNESGRGKPALVYQAL